MRSKQLELQAQKNFKTRTQSREFMRILIVLITVVTFVSGCASLNESLIAGAAIGAAGGGLMGNSQGTGHERRVSTNNGLLIGAALGAGIGYLAYKSKKEKKKEEQNLKLNSNSSETTPFLTKPKIKRIWVKDKIQGKRFIRGHWEYVIEEQSEWSR